MSSLSRARNLQEYGSRGFWLSAPIVILIAGSLQALLQSTPLLAPMLGSATEAVEALAKQYPWLKLIVGKLATLPALVAVGVVLAALREGWRTTLGLVGARVLLTVASGAIAVGEFFSRRRSVSMFALLMLAAALPSGYIWKRRVKQERELHEYFRAHVDDLIARSSLARSSSLDERIRAHDIVKLWDANRIEFSSLGFSAPNDVIVVDLVKDFYLPESPLAFDKAIRTIVRSKEAPTDQPDAPLQNARRMLVARAHIRYALDVPAESAEHVDKAVALFRLIPTSTPFSRSSKVGTGSAFAIAFDIKAAAPDAVLAACANAWDCADKGLRTLEEAEEESSECGYIELKRRNNLVDLLARVASAYATNADLRKLRRAGTPGALLEYLALEEGRLTSCGDLARLPSALAFYTMAESAAARFRLTNATSPEDPRLVSQVRDSARWLLTALTIDPSHKSLEDTRYCVILLSAHGAAFRGVLESAALRLPECK